MLLGARQCLATASDTYIAMPFNIFAFAHAYHTVQNEIPGTGMANLLIIR